MRIWDIKREHGLEDNAMATVSGPQHEDGERRYHAVATGITDLDAIIALLAMAEQAREAHKADPRIADEQRAILEAMNILDDAIIK